MQKNFEIFPYEPGDEEKIVQLLTQTFGIWPRFDLNCSPLEHWMWKYHRNPICMNLVTIAKDNDMIVGVTHSFPLKLKIFDEVVPFAYSGDTAVNPDFRGMGVSNKMYEIKDEMMKREGVLHSYWITDNPILLKSSLKIHLQFPFTTTHYVRIKDVELHLKHNPVDKAWITRIGYDIVKLITDVKKPFYGTHLNAQDVKIAEIHRFDDRADLFWKKVSKTYDFIFERSKDYLNWRYCDSAAGDYTIRIVEGDDKYLGYNVLRINKFNKNYPMGYILDLIAVPERLDVANALVEDAVKFFNGNGINIIDILLVENHPYTNIFKRHGFVNTMKKANLFYNKIKNIGKDNVISKINSVKRAYFSYADIDAI